MLSRGSAGRSRRGSEAADERARRFGVAASSPGVGGRDPLRRARAGYRLRSGVVSGARLLRGRGGSEAPRFEGTSSAGRKTRRATASWPGNRLRANGFVREGGCGVDEAGGKGGLTARHPGEPGGGFGCGKGPHSRGRNQATARGAGVGETRGDKVARVAFRHLGGERQGSCGAREGLAISDEGNALKEGTQERLGHETRPRDSCVQKPLRG